MRDLAAEIEEALEKASAQGKRVAVVFGADWCADSRSLSTALEHPVVAPVVERGFVLVNADVGRRDRHVDIAAGYGIDYARGIPAVAVLDTRGAVVHAQRDGEFRSARTLTVAEIASFFARWSPARGTGERG